MGLTVEQGGVRACVLHREEWELGSARDICKQRISFSRKSGLYASGFPQHGGSLDAPRNLFWKIKTYKQQRSFKQQWAGQWLKRARLCGVSLSLSLTLPPPSPSNIQFISLNQHVKLDTCFLASLKILLKFYSHPQKLY